MSFKKFATSALTAVLALSLLGCGGGGSTETSGTSGTSGSSSGTAATAAAAPAATTEAAPAADSGKIADRVTIGLNVDITTLNQYDPVSHGTNHVQHLLNGYLFYQTSVGGDLISDIGKDYKLSDDGRELTVTIYDYVHDSAGNPIKASDVAWSYNTYIGTGNATGIARYVEKVEAKDDTTVVITIPEAFEESTVAYQAVLTGCVIYAEAAYDPNTWATQPIGTGPYVLDKFVTGSEVSFKRYEDYWQKPELRGPFKQQNVEEIIYKIILENSQLSLALETGEIDATETVSADDLPTFADEDGNGVDGYTVASKLSSLCVNMTFNRNAEAGSPLVDDVNLRKAIAYALDRPAIAKAVMGVTAQAIHAQGNENYADYNPKWADLDYSYNLDEAKKCLGESNYEAMGKPIIRIMCVAQDDKQRLAQLIQSYLINAGINAEVLNYDVALYDNYKYDYSQWDLKIDNQANGYSCIGMWSNFWTTTHTSYNGTPVCFWGEHNEELDALVATASNRSTTSQAAVDACYDYAVVQNCDILGIWAPKTYSVAQDGITNIVSNAAGFLQPQAFTYTADYVGAD